MEYSFCFAVFVAAVGLCVQVDQVLAGGLSKCADFQYKLNNDSNCRDCPACPAGQMYTQNCGYTEINGVIRKTYKECEECPANKYKTSRSPFECDSCTYKCPEGKEMIHPCNRTHDLKCAKCKKGFYTASDGSCMRCSPCCGKPSIFGKLYTEKECEDAGMKDCSCRPLRHCVDKRGSCARSSTTVPPHQNTLYSTTTTTIAKSSSNSECRNKVVLRQLREILSKYKKRVVIKISVEVKNRKKRDARRKRSRDIFSFNQKRKRSRDQWRSF